MADDRLPCWRSVSMDETRSDRVTLRSSAMSLRLVQNASSRLTLVLCPAMTMERLITGDFIDGLLFRCDADREFGGPCLGPPPHGRAPLWRCHGQAAVRRRGLRPCCVRHACGRSAGWRSQPYQSSTFAKGTMVSFNLGGPAICANCADTVAGCAVRPTLPERRGPSDFSNTQWGD